MQFLGSTTSTMRTLELSRTHTEFDRPIMFSRKKSHSAWMPIGGLFIVTLGVFVLYNEPIVGVRPYFQTGIDWVIAPRAYSCRGILPGSSKRPAPSSSTNHTSNNLPKYGVCLMITIGDDGGQPNLKALPYSLLYRLFDEVERSHQQQTLTAQKSTKLDIVDANSTESSIYSREILVGVDYPSLVCKMVKDSLGPSAVCTDLDELRAMETQVQCKHLVVGKTKRFVPQLLLAGGDEIFWESIVTVDLDAEDPDWNPPAVPDWRPTFVTGFSSNHLAVGLLMLRSLGKAAAGQSKHNVSVVVWAMGDFNRVHRALLDCVVEELNERYRIATEVRQYNLSTSPAWNQTNEIDNGAVPDGADAGLYVSKATMIHTVLLERGIAVWQDAGCRYLDSESVVQTLDNLLARGFSSRSGEGKVGQLTYKEELRYLRADFPALLDQQLCDASLCGFTLKTYTEVLRPWYECSNTRQCIEPDGSDRQNHRQDQAALSVIAGLSGMKCEGMDASINVLCKDFQPDDYSGTDTTNCYKDPLAALFN